MEESYPLPVRPTLPAMATGHPRAVPGAVRRGALWREWLATLFTTAAIFLFTETYVLQGYKVYGSCMEPNLFTGERLLGNKTAYELGHIARGEIVVFRPPHRPETPFIKRVIGLPGDLLEIRGGRVFLNGVALVEPYLHLAWYDDRPPVRVLPGMVFVMGDNRDNSSDSRAWGELPIGNIQARAWLRYWPLSRFEVLR
jgi:signal peptidase I